VQWLDVVQDTGELPAGANADADAVAARLAETDAAAETPSTAVPATTVESTVSPAGIVREQVAMLAVRCEGAAGRMASAARLTMNVLHHMRQASHVSTIEQALAASLESEQPAPLSAAIEAVLPLLAGSAADAVITPVAARADPLSRTLRVDTQRINALVNLTGELTVAKNAVGHLAQRALDGGNPLAPAFRDEHARLDRLIGLLQQAVVSLRVVPLRSTFQRFARLVREISATLGKPTRLETEGDDTETDRAIAEMLFEPLLHVVRNAMDHGIEPGPERASAGKPAIATLRLRARREGEHVIVDIEDDGRGISAALVRRVAAELSLAAPDVLSGMNDVQVLDLIFAPGFSTAREVSGLSGRGVGMDAVRTTVERIGGRVQVESRLGQGTTVRFVLPFSMMLTRVMTVEAGGQVFGIPLDAIVETVRVPRERIRPVGAAHALVLRDRTITLIDLARTLGGREGHAGPEAIIVVAQSRGEFAALEVEKLGIRMDLMLKPPEGLLAGISGIGGTATLGDGSVLLVLDLQSLLQ
jgi:two-component system chemotaxis sensor kinase CheA